MTHLSTSFSAVLFEVGGFGHKQFTFFFLHTIEKKKSPNLEESDGLSVSMSMG